MFVIILRESLQQVKRYLFCDSRKGVLGIRLDIFLFLFRQRTCHTEKEFVFHQYEISFFSQVVRFSLMIHPSSCSSFNCRYNADDDVNTKDNYLSTAVLPLRIIRNPKIFEKIPKIGQKCTIKSHVTEKEN